MRALVTGATGYIGSRLIPVLLEQGWEVLAGARTVSKLDHVSTVMTDRVGAVETIGGQARARVVELDVMDAASCRRALSTHGPVDVAYYLVHGLGEGDFAATDEQAARTFAAAARQAGVRRIVYLGGLVPAGEELSEHLASRAAVARTLTRTAAAGDSSEGLGEAPSDGTAASDATGSLGGPGSSGGTEVVWLRAGLVLGAGSTSYELVRHLVDRLVLIPIPSWMGHRVQPIAVDDVTHYLLHAADPAVAAGAYDVGGPDVLTYRDLVAAQARASRRRRVLVKVPGVATGLAGRIIAAVVPIPGELVKDLVDSLNNTMVVTDDRLRALVPAPAGGVSTVEQALARSAASARGDQAAHDPGSVSDPLHRTSTDPDWAH